MDDGVGFVDLEEFVNEGTVCEVASDEGEVVEAVDVFGSFNAGFDVGDWRGRNGADFGNPFSTAEVVDEDDSVVSLGCNSESSGPADIAISACY